ncbi:MAG: hypothetical protein ACJ768_21305, partial [Gaiellaceae bacterium]
MTETPDGPHTPQVPQNPQYAQHPHIPPQPGRHPYAGPEWRRPEAAGSPGPYGPQAQPRPGDPMSPWGSPVAMAERPARTGAGTRHARGMLALAQLDHVARVRVEGRTQDEV